MAHFNTSTDARLKNMNTSISVEKCVGDIAAECIRDWTAKSSDQCATTVFKSAFVEGNRREGISKELFNHIWSELSAMTCWEKGEVEAPWKSTIIYDIPPNMLEKDVEDLRKECHVLTTTLECDDQGNDALLHVSYLEAPPLHMGITKHATVQVCVERQSGARNYIKNEADFKNIAIHVTKRLTFKEHFDWHYDFTMRYREPYYNIRDLMEDVADKDMIFRDPPVCIFNLSCSGVKDTHDYKYFTDSFLCKVMDVLPPAWRSTPLHVKTPAPTKK